MPYEYSICWGYLKESYWIRLYACYHCQHRHRCRNFIVCSLKIIVQTAYISSSMRCALDPIGLLDFIRSLNDCFNLLATLNYCLLFHFFLRLVLGRQFAFSPYAKYFFAFKKKCFAIELRALSHTKIIILNIYCFEAQYNLDSCILNSIPSQCAKCSECACWPLCQYMYI